MSCENNPAHISLFRPYHYLFSMPIETAIIIVKKLKMLVSPTSFRFQLFIASVIPVAPPRASVLIPISALSTTRLRYQIILWHLLL